MNKDCTSALYEIISQNGVPEDCKHILLCIIGSTKTPDKLVVADLFGGNENARGEAQGMNTEGAYNGDTGNFDVVVTFMGNIYAESSMRANNHDFTNKLHVILGLIQIGQYDEAEVGMMVTCCFPRLQMSMPRAEDVPVCLYMDLIKRKSLSKSPIPYSPLNLAFPFEVFASLLKQWGRKLFIVDFPPTLAMVSNLNSSA